MPVVRSIARFAASLAGLVALASVTTVSVLAHGGGEPAPTLVGALATWSGEPVPWIAVVAAAAAYLFAVLRVNGGHPRVPVPTWRVAAWLAGLATILVALSSALDVYADDLLSVHMVQHLLLAMVAPPLLALGAPVTLLLRVLSPSARRRLALPVLHSRAVRVLAAPLVAWVLFAAVMALTHFTPLYEAALENPTIHMAEHALFLGAGLLFWLPAVAADPIPRRLGYGARMVYLGLQMPLNAAVGLAIYFAPVVLYARYATGDRSWGPDPLTDQQIGGVLMWGVGDLILLLAIPLVVAGWMRADARHNVTLDARLRDARRAVPLTIPSDVRGE
jgi:putative copper resistance protein D